MSALTKAQARAPKKRNTTSLQLREYEAPLLVAEASGTLALYFRKSKAAIDSDEGLVAMVADMTVDENGERMFAPEEVPPFLDGLSMESVTDLVKACLSMLAPGGNGAPGNSKPSTSAE
jgi:hypothetical protein